MALILRCAWNNHDKQLSPSESPIYIDQIICCQKCGNQANGNKIEEIKPDIQKAGVIDEGWAHIVNYCSNWTKYPDNFHSILAWNMDIQNELNLHPTWGRILAAWTSKPKADGSKVILILREICYQLITSFTVSTIGSGTSIDYLNLILKQNGFVP